MFDDEVTEDGHVPWSRFEPDAAVVAALERPPDPGLSDFERVERIGAWERIAAWAQAAQYAEISGYVGLAEQRAFDACAAHDPDRDGPLGVSERPEWAAESAQADIQLMLRLTTVSAAARVQHARELELFPSTAAEFARGRLSWPKMRIVVDGCAGLTPEQTERVQAAVLPKAPEQTTGQLRAAVRRAVLRENSEILDERRRRRVRTRGVRVQSGTDGMATLSAYVPAAAATGMYAVLDQHARACGSSDGRTMDHRRADALTDLVLRDTGLCSSGTADLATATADPAGFTTSSPDGVAPTPPGGSPFVRNSVSVQIRVTVGLDTLLGVDDEPAELAGFGPIPAADARELAADPQSTWWRLLTDPPTGRLVEHGTTRYRPPVDMVRRVQARYDHCQFPGCRVPAHRCDIDHAVPHHAATGTGPTDDPNLGPKCRPHHRLKTLAGWHVDQLADGTSVWRTPSGHVYESEPARLPGTAGRPAATRNAAAIRTWDLLNGSEVPIDDGEPAPF